VEVRRDGARPLVGLLAITVGGDGTALFTLGLYDATRDQDAVRHAVEGIRVREP
jgi:hypothetical protein